MTLAEPHVSRQDIEKLIGAKPKNLDIYRQALVHKSVYKYIVENDVKEYQSYMKNSFERLEFLGDSILNFVVADLIYSRYSNEDEGFMTRLRTKIVRGTTCVTMAKKIGLGQYILTAPIDNEARNEVRLVNNEGIVINDKILEDSFESLIGAIYKDLGISYAEFFILKLINECINFDKLLTVDDNYKDIIMRYTQMYKYELPIYKLIKDEKEQTVGVGGRNFSVSVSLRKNGVEVECGIGTGPTKKEAEQAACKAAICHIPDCYCKKIHMKELAPVINRTKKC
jgi:ribonuclease-3